MTNFIKIIISVFVTILPYLIIIYIFPTLWNKIDNLTWTEINSNIIIKIDNIFGNISIAKGSTDNFIDGIWSNSKNKISNQINNINEIQKK